MTQFIPATQIPLELIIPKNWKRSFLLGGILIEATSLEEVEHLINGARVLLEQCAERLGRIVFVWSEGQSEQDGITIQNPTVQRIMRQMRDRYRSEEDFINEALLSGNVVTVTSNVTRDKNGYLTNTDHPLYGRDICYFNRIPAERGIVQPFKRIGKSYRGFWRAGANNVDALSNDYHRMRNWLAREGKYDEPHCGYRIAQELDGVWYSSYCEYDVEFTLAEFWGDIVRIAISKPNGYREIRREELTLATVAALAANGTTSVIN